MTRLHNGRLTPYANSARMTQQHLTLISSPFSLTWWSYIHTPWTNQVIHHLHSQTCSSWSRAITKDLKCFSKANQVAASTTCPSQNVKTCCILKISHWYSKGWPLQNPLHLWFIAIKPDHKHHSSSSTTTRPETSLQHTQSLGNILHQIRVITGRKYPH